MDLSILSLDTLEAIKRDALTVNNDPGADVAARIEAREVRDLVNRELDRRIDWANAARAALVDLGPITDPAVHTIGGKPINDLTNPGEYGRTHDMDCPACVAGGSSFTTSPRSETYWSS